MTRDVTVSVQRCFGETGKRPACQVSNHQQVSNSLANFSRDIAQSFTTGSNPLGYKLTRVELALQGGIPSTAYTVAIRSDSAGSPGTLLGTPRKSADFAGDFPFPAQGDGIDLDPNTKYWVLIDSVTADARGTIWGTSSDAEEAGAAAGWSIGNVALRRGVTAGAFEEHPEGWSLKLAIDGYPFRPWEMSAATRWAERWEGRGFPRHCIAPVATARAVPPGPEQLPPQRQPAPTGDDSGRLDVEFSRCLCDDGLPASCRDGAGKARASRGVDG
ncbi:MAG: hypothetical protein OXI20_17305 [Rhodospirillales bacterium]|nr:hypothetical protein [Rhodospirillales bacterium]